MHFLHAFQNIHESPVGVTQKLIFYLLKIFNINFGKTVFIMWTIRDRIFTIDMDKVRWTYCIISHRVAKYLKPILYDVIAVMANCHAYYYILVIYCVFIQLVRAVTLDPIITTHTPYGPETIISHIGVPVGLTFKRIDVKMLLKI